MGENSHARAGVGEGGRGLKIKVVLKLSCDLVEQKVKGNVGIIKTLL